MVDTSPQWPPASVPATTSTVDLHGVPGRRPGQRRPRRVPPISSMAVALPRIGDELDRVGERHVDDVVGPPLGEESAPAAHLVPVEVPGIDVVLRRIPRAKSRCSSAPCSGFPGAWCRGDGDAGRRDEIDAVGLAVDMFVDPVELDLEALGLWPAAPTPMPPAFDTSTTTSRQCVKATRGKLMPSMSQMGDFMAFPLSYANRRLPSPGCRE